MKTPNGDVSVPINHAYNHHFEAFLVGQNAKLMKFAKTEDTPKGMNHGAQAFWRAVDTRGVIDVELDPEQPSHHFFSEGNGGEYRKSYHGYPKGFAQVIEMPKEFHIQPM